MMKTEEDNRIPVTILSGFLGSGKTTLLNQMIQQNKDKKLAIIENEFGEISIDSDLVVGVKDNFFELKNGCVCCSLNGELSETLYVLLAKGEKIDHLIVETTGIADPGPVALSFLSDYHIQSTFRLDSIVTLVDVQFIERQLENEEEAGKQIALADTIVLSKIDNVEAYKKEIAENIIKRINPQAAIYESSFGKIEGVDLLEMKVFNSTEEFQRKFERNKFKKEKPILSFSPSVKTSTTNSFSFRQSHISTKVLKHHITVASHSFEFVEKLDIVKFDLWMSMMLSLNSESIYRIKGVLNFEGTNDKVIFQSVHTQFISTSGGTWESEAVRKSRIVIIGKNLNRKDLKIGLYQCFYDGEFKGIKAYTVKKSTN